MSGADLAELFGRFLMLSLLAIGGGITVVPEMHRFMVERHGWLSDADFSASIALAQAAPGPNILLVTVMGWNAGGWAGALATTAGILLPSTTVALLAHRGAERWREQRLVRAFREGTLPITLGLLAATGWLLAAPTAGRPAGLLLTLITALLVWRTRIHPLWLLAAGALIGALSGAPAAAASPVRFTPTGEVAELREVRAVFAEAMVRLGDGAAADPYQVDCPAAGRGRWVDPVTWVWRLDGPARAGLRCSFTPRPGVRALSGAAPVGFVRQRVGTPAPEVLRSVPWEGSPVTEDQVFLLVMTGPVGAEAAARRAWCRIAGVGERIAVRVLPERERQALARRLAPEEPDTLALACVRSLPPKARVDLVWEPDTATVEASGGRVRPPQVIGFEVRDPLAAQLVCTRENPNAPCSPLGDLRIAFGAPVPRAQALAARLRIAGADRSPTADGERDAPEIETIVFRGPLPESADFTLSLPAGLRDADGRTLTNAAQFPLRGRTASYPPLAKFAAAPFGIVELDQAPAVPLALRRVERDLLMREAPAGRGSVRSLRVVDDAQMIAWYSRVHRLHERVLPPEDLRAILEPGARAEAAAVPPPATRGPTRRTRDAPREPPPPIETRSVGLLAREPDARVLALPQAPKEGDWPFELVGVPVPEPGLHVLEIASPKLGQALLGREAPMYVRTAVLVTNLAVHYKQGLDNALVWVTSLDRGRPVAGAQLRIADCQGRLLWEGRSDAQGIARVSPAPPAPAADCGDDRPGHFVSARIRDTRGREDVSFAWSGWTQGIEPWRFELPTDGGGSRPVLAHTIFDRTLVRAGDTVSMKHLVRSAGSQGLRRPPDAMLPAMLTIIHEGSGQSWQQALVWQQASAASSFRVPPGARLGRYQVYLEAGPAEPGRQASLGAGRQPSGSFRVEAFRQPVFDASLAMPAALAPGAREAAADLRIGWYAGGAAARLPVRVSARLRPEVPAFAGWEGFRFERPDLLDEGEGLPGAEGSAAAAPGAAGAFAAGVHRDRLLLDKLALELDAQGGARVRIGDLPPLAVPHRLEVEATFADPSGEIQSVARSTLAYPSQLVVGVRTEGWAAIGESMAMQVAVLDTAGRPLKQRALTVRGRLERTISHRKRLVGGLYAYENQRVVRELGELCRARTESSGVAVCTIRPQLPAGETGQLVLVASADDDAGRTASASASVWLADRGELWFDAQAQDRIDLLPEKRRVAPGETARLQVRMPFRQASALVTIEREGILEARVVSLRGTNPTLEVPVKADWGPNVFVSVMPVRGRLREVPWYSVFVWGWRSPADWWREYRGSGELPPAKLAPTATVDLARPAFRLGIAELAVGSDASRLSVRVTPAREQYRVREQATVTIDVRLPDGRTPAAGARVAVAAVDEALLALLPNTSWQLLEAMMPRRALAVQTATGQMQVVGKRHFGRKAVPAGGDGGRNPARELFDTLLYWNPSVVVDARGQARVQVPLNDTLSRFRIVAIAESGDAFFGTGEATIRSHQPLQLAAGLPQAVREGDHLDAGFTVRNHGSQPMQVAIALRARVADAPADAAPVLAHTRSLRLEPGASQGLTVPLTVPARAQALDWQIDATEPGGQRDSLKLRQTVAPAVPPTVRQAALLPVAPQATLALQTPAGALPGRSQLRITLTDSLTGSALSGVRDWWQRYPHSCLEQRAARAIGLGDPGLWQAVIEALPAYLDRDGLAAFFPPRDGEPAGGSETLTAWLLGAAAAAGMPLPAALRDAMLDGLAAFVEGRLQRAAWAPRPDRDERRLAAMAALAAHGRLPLAMAATLEPAVTRLPVTALLDWLAILEASPALPRRAVLREQASQQLRARLIASGPALGLAGARDDEAWWLLGNGDTALARVLLHALHDERWRADAPRLALGLVARQRTGAWSTTTANAWGPIALRRFADRDEAGPIGGSTRASLGDGPALVANWPAPQAPQPGTPAGAPAGPRQDGRTGSPPEPAALTLALPAGASQLRLTHEGGGRPWAQVRVLAAVPLAQPVAHGFRVSRSLEAIERREPGLWHRGDLVRVRLTVEADATMPWVALVDPLPPGAAVLGAGLGREARLGADADPEAGGRAREATWPPPTFVERQHSAVRAYWETLPGGRRVFSYVMRLNQPGDFRLPPTRVEAMYLPEVFGESPNAPMVVRP